MEEKGFIKALFVLGEFHHSKNTEVCKNKMFSRKTFLYTLCKDFFIIYLCFFRESLF
ncbi:hypothetical protein CCA_00790 [Chlamydia caviae GPIC]|uniref:Uncharacterized protein n=1 Tax=Chlamydia caviae (strain ATCC VR-813 / DSM 19441 / 03DC25 / GPIC) TaxID=227941 RepID=Q821Z5_CHLCV|nr:hypothetical protein CCA_00790 [Chlamydia caviae GPIC]